jgi:hypothetical protein
MPVYYLAQPQQGADVVIKPSVADQRGSRYASFVPQICRGHQAHNTTTYLEKRCENVSSLCFFKKIMVRRDEMEVRFSLVDVAFPPNDSPKNLLKVHCTFHLGHVSVKEYAKNQMFYAQKCLKPRTR